MPPENQNQNTTPHEAHVRPVSPFEKEKKKEYTPNPYLKTLRTYQGDVEETIKNKETSVAGIFVAEQKSKEKNPKKDFSFSEKKLGNILMSYGLLPLLGIILIISGIGAIVFIYYSNMIRNSPVVVATHTTLIPYTDTKVVELNTPQSVNYSNRTLILQNLLEGVRTYTKPVGSVLYIQFLNNKTELSSADFFQNIAPTAPATLSRSLSSQYMAGIYSFDTNTVFLIFSSADYGATYAGMLKWEMTMTDDLSSIFPIQKTVVTASSTGATLVFQDDTFNNQDVRVIRDTIGNIVLMYGFIDKNTVAITKNEKIFQELVSAYRNNKLVR